MSASVPPERKTRHWLWYFILLTALTAIAITVQISYNRSRLPTLEQAQAAAERWRTKGPIDYDLEFTKEIYGGDKELYKVKVRGGKVVESTRNGVPEQERLFRYRDARAMLNDVEEFIRTDVEAAEKGIARPYIRAEFDRELGYVRHFVRSVNAQRERVEINATLKPVALPRQS